MSQYTVNAAASRLNLYAGIHKTLRALMSDTLLKIGRMDVDDPAELGQTLAQVRQLLQFCASHIEHENRFIHAAMEARRPGSAAVTAEDHIGHEQHIDELEAAVRALERSAGRERQTAATRLYRQMGLFVAENLEHMEVEESENNAILWEAYTDAELIGLHEALVATIPPDEKTFTLRWMVPHITPKERVACLSELRALMPSTAFDGLLEQIKPLLNQADWDKLQQSLFCPVQAI